MYTLGVNLSHHSSITLLKDNEVLLFVTEERLNRKKYFRGVPSNALTLIKNYTKNIDAILLVSGSQDSLNQCIKILNKQGVRVGTRLRVNNWHHLAHAASGFYMSQFDQATILVVDGAGAMYGISDSSVRASETTSFYKGTFPYITCTNKHFVIGIYDKRPFVYTDNDILKFKNKFNNINVSVDERHDIGWRYADITARIGFGIFGEGKTMGLSAYGKDNPNDIKIKQAHDIQKQLESVFLSLAANVTTSNLVLSGGCALNILGNSLIKRHYPNLNIFVDPVAADATVALGAAAYHFYSQTRCIDKLIFAGYDGPSYSLEKDYIYECTRKYSIQ